jgi:hypothetical protein
VQRVFKRKPPRLDLIFQRFGAPVYFVTFNTHIRTSLLATPEVHAAFIEYCRGAADFRIGVGRYVIMPDHSLLRSNESYAAKGIMCSRIRYAHDSLLVLKTGHTQVRSCELIERDKAFAAAL